MKGRINGGDRFSLFLVLIVLVIGLIVGLQMVQKSQENRSNALYIQDAGSPGIVFQNYWYLTTPDGDCKKTSTTYSSASTCQANLTKYLSGKTTGVCYTSWEQCYTSKCSEFSRKCLNSYTIGQCANGVWVKKYNCPSGTNCIGNGLCR